MNDHDWVRQALATAPHDEPPAVDVVDGVLAALASRPRPAPPARSMAAAALIGWCVAAVAVTAAARAWSAATDPLTAMSAGLPATLTEVIP
jgi:hypothetical protein